jgi:hypothetical protein
MIYLFSPFLKSEAAQLGNAEIEMAAGDELVLAFADA